MNCKDLFGLFPYLRNELLVWTPPENENLFAGTLLAKKELFARTTPSNCNLFAGTPRTWFIFKRAVQTNRFVQGQCAVILLLAQASRVYKNKIL